MRKLPVFHHANARLLVDQALREMLSAQPLVTICTPVFAQFEPHNLANRLDGFRQAETVDSQYSAASKPAAALFKHARNIHPVERLREINQVGAGLPSFIILGGDLNDRGLRSRFA